ncbi:MAG: hypothetical protein ACP5HK_07455, partial [Acidilobus sp.]
AGPWSPSSPPDAWFCFPVMWPEGSQAGETVSSAQGIVMSPNLSAWAFDELAGPTEGQPLVARAIVVPLPGASSAYLTPACANWSVLIGYYLGGQYHRLELRPEGQGALELPVPRGASFVNATAVAWVGGVPAFENVSLYGPPPARPLPSPPGAVGLIITMGPLGYAMIIALASSLGALAAMLLTRRPTAQARV